MTQLPMAPDVEMERAKALRLFGEGDLHSALATLRPIVEDSDDPEDRLMLGRMAFVATDFAEAKDQLERAYREFQAVGLSRRAAMTAIAPINWAPARGGRLILRTGLAIVPWSARPWVTGGWPWCRWAASEMAWPGLTRHAP